MKAGTQGYSQREAAKRQAEFERLTAINNNRTALMNATIAELIALYGTENVNTGHPLFNAILSSANGSIIDLDQLAADMTAFKNQEDI